MKRRGRRPSRSILGTLSVALVATLALAGCLAPGSVGNNSMSPGGTTDHALASASPGRLKPALAADWPVYHGDPAGTGLATSFPALGSGLTQAWSTTLDGAVYGEPLGVAGHVIVATEVTPSTASIRRRARSPGIGTSARRWRSR